jgi:hypothetical protein
VFSSFSSFFRKIQILKSRIKTLVFSAKSWKSWKSWKTQWFCIVIQSRSWKSWKTQWFCLVLEAKAGKAGKHNDFVKTHFIKHNYVLFKRIPSKL